MSLTNYLSETLGGTKQGQLNVKKFLQRNKVYLRHRTRYGTGTGMVLVSKNQYRKKGRTIDPTWMGKRKDKTENVKKFTTSDVLYDFLHGPLMSTGTLQGSTGTLQ